MRKYISILAVLAGLFVAFSAVSAQETAPPPDGTYQQPPPPPPPDGTYQQQPPPPSGSYSCPPGSTCPPPPSGSQYCPPGSQCPPPPGGQYDYKYQQPPSGCQPGYPCPPPPSGQYDQQKTQQPYQQQQPQPYDQQKPGQYPGEMGSGEHGPMMGPGKMGQGDESGFGEEQEARVNEQRFKGMKQGTGQAKRMINGMKKMVTQQEKKLGECGVSLPVELKEAVSSSNLVIAKLEAAKTADELEEIFTDLQEVVSPMQEWGPKLGDLHRLCEMVKRAGSETKDSSKTGKEVKRLQKLINTPRYKTQISLGGRIDITDLVSEYKEKFGKLQESLAKVKDEAKTDPEAALETLEDSFYGTAMSDLQSIKMAIDMVENMTRGLQSAKRDISGFEKALKGLKRQNVIAERKKMDTKDTSELESLVSLLKANVAEITAFVKVKGFDPDELVDKVQAASEVREDIQEKLAELRGVSEFVPQIKGGQNFNFQLPDAFNFSPQGTPGMSGAPETGSAPGAGFGPGPGDQSGFGPQGFGGPGSGAGPGFGGPSGPPSGGFGF